MPFNVNQFNADVAKSGIANASHFEAWILAGPRIAGNLLSEFGIDYGMAFRIESVNLPGRTLTTLDQQYHGPLRSIPYRFTTQPISFSIIMSKDMRERQFFMKWQDYFTGHYRTNVNRSPMPAQFDTLYYDDAIGTIEIRQYSYPLPKPGAANISKENSQAQKTQGQTRSASSEPYQLQTRITLYEAYPITVNDIQMSWGDEGYGKLQVEMRYHYYTEEHLSSGASSNYEAARLDRAANVNDFETISQAQRSAPDLIPELLRNRPGQTGNRETDVGTILG